MRRLINPQVETFFERGFLVVPGVFAEGEIAEMRRAFSRLQQTAEYLGESRMFRGSQFVIERAGGGQVRIQRIVWCGAAEPVLSTYGRDPRLLELASRILGSREMNQLINQAHFKLPGDGVAFPWHQDSTHRRFGRGEWRDLNGKGSYVQTVTAIDDVCRDNGPLELIPGSNRLGHLGLSEEEPLPPGLLNRETVAATMRAGDVLLFGPYTLHRSRPNVSNRPRRVLINGFAYPGANSRVYPGEGAGRLLRHP
jgi:ectoine hydroxylase-related dioxygenase (phytanoyl-CoA dioxygenase family)